MKEQLQQTLVDSLEYLMSLTKEDIRPEEAKTRLNLLQKQYPETQMNLLWEEQAYDYSLHYDTLLYLAGEGTISLSFCPESSLPWPMRGIHRWSESDLLRVNDTILKVGDAVANLDFIWDETHLMSRLIDACIIRQIIEKEPIEISDAELQQAMNTFRKTQKLHKVEDTYKWMAQQGITHERFENLIAERATLTKLKDKITADQVENYFQEHQTDFDTAFIAYWNCDGEQTAWEIWEQISNGKVDFYKAAQNYFLTTAENNSRVSWDLFSKVQRNQTSSYLREAIFNASSDEILKPLLIDKGYAMIYVLSFSPSCFDETTKKAIKNILFEEWLAQCRQEATIEWYWG